MAKIDLKHTHTYIGIKAAKHRLQQITTNYVGDRNSAIFNQFIKE